jgi:hypothetical protein
MMSLNANPVPRTGTAFWSQEQALSLNRRRPSTPHSVAFDCHRLLLLYCGHSHRRAANDLRVTQPGGGRPIGDTMNGKRGEHPLTDILVYGMEIYGPEADELIREISELSSRRELYEWWDEEINWSTDRASVLAKSDARFTELMQRSRNSGWRATESS